MKKILSLLLVLVLCLSLCACGNENEPPASSTPGNPSSSGATSAPGSSSNGATIEITAENWQEYFDLTYDRNPEQIIAGQYGEISIWGHRRLLTLKKKYASWTDDMNISIEFLCTGGYISLSNYNPKTGITSSTSPIRPMPDYYGKLRLTKDHIQQGAYAFGAIDPESLVVSENSVMIESICYEKMEITAIQGTITFRYFPVPNFP